MRAAIEFADILRVAGPAYRAANAAHLSLHQLKIMSAVEHCRTAALEPLAVDRVIWPPEPQVRVRLLLFLADNCVNSAQGE